jgi:hypothetical protein
MCQCGYSPGLWNADAQLAASQRTLDAASDAKKVELSSLMKTDGAEAVVHLINHVTALAAKRGKH